MDRISFLERELRHFDAITLERGVTEVLRTSEFPPTVKVLHAACSKFAKKVEGNNARTKRHFPGDVVNGQRTLTALEAKQELIRIGKECPQALTLEPFKGEDGGTLGLGRERLNLMVSRIYVKALRRCIHVGEQGGGIDVADLVQNELF